MRPITAGVTLVGVLAVAFVVTTNSAKENPSGPVTNVTISPPGAEPLPARFTATVVTKYGPDVPLAVDKPKCTYGSFELDHDGVRYSVCARTQWEYDQASPGGKLTR